MATNTSVQRVPASVEGAAADGRRMWALAQLAFLKGARDRARIDHLNRRLGPSPLLTQRACDNAEAQRAQGDQAGRGLVQGREKGVALAALHAEQRLRRHCAAGTPR